MNKIKLSIDCVLVLIFLVLCFINLFKGEASHDTYYIGLSIFNLIFFLIGMDNIDNDLEHIQKDVDKDN